MTVRNTFSARAITALLFVAAPLTPVTGQVHYGAGGMTCQQYTTGAADRTLAYHEANEWLLGYASGMNAARSSDGIDPLLSSNSANLLAFVQAFCTSNAASPIVKAANEWFKALARP